MILFRLIYVLLIYFRLNIDFIVDFEPIEVGSYADNYFDLKFSLQDILQKPIDLLEERALKNPYFKESINRQKALIYGH